MTFFFPTLKIATTYLFLTLFDLSTVSNLSPTKGVHLSMSRDDPQQKASFHMIFPI